MGKETELVDLVNAQGVIQRIKVLRNEVDLYPNLHLQIAIAVIFDGSGNILVQQRALTKKSEPGYLDHICGGIISGESPEQTAVRETKEESGLEPYNIRIIDRGLNVYKRFRYLLIGRSDGNPGQIDPSEVEWVKFKSLTELEALNISKKFKFVEEFFEDTQKAIAFNKRYS